MAQALSAIGMLNDVWFGDLLKALHWDGQGLCLYAKRLELPRARFVWPQTDSGTITLTAAQVSMLLEGIDWRMPVAHARLDGAARSGRVSRISRSRG